MSGWIKVEKDLANDPRVLRMASRLRNADVTLGSRSRVMVIGALVTLWWYADTHIRQDDTLPVGTDQIDELVGLTGFCDLMPSEWFEIIDSNNVKLVNYLTHNGTSEKKRALNQKRQETFRRKHNAHVTLPSRSSVTRPRPREDLDKKKRGEVRAARLPPDWSLTEELREVAKAEGLDPERTAAKFKDYWVAVAGAKGRKLDWVATWRNWCRSDADRNSKNAATTSSDNAAALVWDRLLKSSGSDPPRSPEIQAAIDAAGGWSAIRMRTPFEESQLKRKFCEAYHEPLQRS